MALTKEARSAVARLRDGGDAAARDSLMEMLAQHVPAARAVADGVLEAAGASRAADVCEKLLGMRMIGDVLLYALAEAGGPQAHAKLWAAVDNNSTADATAFCDAVNNRIVESRKESVPLCLYRPPRCAACDAINACLECPHCANDLAGPDSLFFCTRECFEATWPQHAPLHATAQRHAIRRLMSRERRRRQRRRRHGLVEDVFDVVEENLSVIVVVAVVVPLLAYFATFWTKKYFGWSIAYLGISK